jgi:hypothetical protein
MACALCFLVVVLGIVVRIIVIPLLGARFMTLIVQVHMIVMSFVIELLAVYGLVMIGVNVNGIIIHIKSLGVILMMVIVLVSVSQNVRNIVLGQAWIVSGMTLIVVERQLRILI